MNYRLPEAQEKGRVLSHKSMVCAGPGQLPSTAWQPFQGSVNPFKAGSAGCHSNNASFFVSLKPDVWLPPCFILASASVFSDTW